MEKNKDLIKENSSSWKIEKEGEMKVQVKIFADDTLLKKMQEDSTLKQAKNMAKLPGVLEPVVVLSDAHQGYGACIGGVSAMDLEKGVISPGQIGYDIDCSVRLLKTNLKLSEIKGKEKLLVETLFKAVPSGVGRGGKITVSRKELDEVLKKGAAWAVEKGYGRKQDLDFLEDKGCLIPCNPDDVSERAKKRGIGQLGTLGSGNHFLELGVVDNIYNEKAAKVLGLEKNQITIMIHCGSRGLGHQVASDYIKLMEEKYGYPEFDRELVNAPINSELGKKYFSAMNCSANFAFANKQIISHLVQENLKKIFPEIKIDVVYEVCHNIAKIENYEIPENNKKQTKQKQVLVMRKGATRSFGPGRQEVPEKYREVGQPVLIPGSMGTASYVLVGTKKAETISWASTVHGAGRVKSRTVSSKQQKGNEVKQALHKKGIEVMSESLEGLAEEAPDAYKDIDEVVKVVDEAGISEKVARLKPLVVIKG